MLIPKSAVAFWGDKGLKLFSYALVLLGFGFPNVVFAGPVMCIFSKECFEDEACVATELRLSFGTTQDNPDGLNLISDSETLPVEIISVVEGERVQMLANSESAVHLFSWNFHDSYARYTVHMQGPLAVTYLGGCGGTP